MNKRYLDQHMKKILTSMLIAAFSVLASLAIAQQAPEGAEADASAMQQAPEAEANSSLRLEARLQPVIAVDASGQARLDAEVGMAFAASRFFIRRIRKDDLEFLGVRLLT